MSPRKSGALSGPFNWPAAAASSAPPAIGTVPKASPARPDIRPSPPSLHQHRTHQTTTLTAVASTTVTSMGRGRTDCSAHGGTGAGTKRRARGEPESVTRDVVGVQSGGPDD